MPNVIIDLVQVLRFYSRLPIPALPGETNAHAAPDFARIVWAIPLAGAILGGLSALILLLANLIFAAFIAATLAIAASVWMTGAFHEDGLADTADGLGGGMSRERKLEIMRDSRIGTYGAVALILALLLRVGTVEGLLSDSPIGAALALTISGGVSRMMALIVLLALPPAREDGAAFAAGIPGQAMTTVGVALAACLLAFSIPFYGLMAVFVATSVAGFCVLTVILLAKHTIGGQTGDIAGAAQQAADVGILLGLLACVNGT